MTVVGTTGEMTRSEIKEFLTCSRVGRLATCAIKEPYVIPLGYVYWNDMVYFHSCKGKKLNFIRKNPNVCFEVDIDESTNEINRHKSVVIVGKARIVKNYNEKQEFFRKLVSKYRNLDFQEYVRRQGYDFRARMKLVEVYRVIPKEIVGRTTGYIG